MQKVKVQIVNKSGNELPRYETTGAAGLDVRASIEEKVTLAPGDRSLIPTGLSVAIPEGYEIQVRPRSGLAYKHGISVVNTPGTVDSDYRGEIGIVLINHSQTDFHIEDGDRIGQLVLNQVEQLEWEPVEQLNETDRGAGGYGHTGKA